MLHLLSVGSVMSYIWWVVVAILSLLVMVMIHEFGHYVAGKALGFKIEEFSVGFGPKIIQRRKKNGELFSLRAIPLGGYCAFDGEDENSESTTGFNNQKPWKRLIVLAAGAIFNFLSAIIFSYILLVAFGYEDVQVKKIADNSFAYQVEQHVEVGDRVVGIDGVDINFVHDDNFNGLLSEYVKTEEFKASCEEKEDGFIYGLIPLDIERHGEKMTVYGVLQKQQDKDGSEVWSFINEGSKGEMVLKPYRYGFVEAIGESFAFSGKWAYKIILILGDLFTGQLSLKSLGGPVTTIKIMAETSRQNIMYLFVLVPVIAVNLAVFNLLPIPSLDGARMVFVVIEWIRKKPINRNVEANIHMIGLFILLGFVLLVDVLQFI